MVVVLAEARTARLQEVAASLARQWMSRLSPPIVPQLAEPQWSGPRRRQRVALRNAGRHSQLRHAPHADRPPAGCRVDASTRR